jgi:hypothetical protein
MVSYEKSIFCPSTLVDDVCNLKGLSLDRSSIMEISKSINPDLDRKIVGTRSRDALMNKAY